MKALPYVGGGLAAWSALSDAAQAQEAMDQLRNGGGNYFDNKAAQTDLTEGLGGLAYGAGLLGLGASGGLALAPAAVPMMQTAALSRAIQDKARAQDEGMRLDAGVDAYHYRSGFTQPDAKPPMAQYIRDPETKKRVVNPAWQQFTRGQWAAKNGAVEPQ